LLSCRNLCLSYDGKLAVEGVTFDVDPGDYLCVVGENGSGKSTLMKGILGLMKPASGEIIIDGVGRDEIGYMPQQTAHQRDFPASVREVVLSGCANRLGTFAFYSASDKKKAEESMERLGIAQFRRKPYRALSGGTRQRALLARALVAARELIMLDEPASGLDPIAGGEMYSLLDGLNRDGMTIVMISHDLRSAMRYGNKILHLKRRPLFFGTTRDYAATSLYIRMRGGDDFD
jgi:zinc transport system ATP-binding protein